MYIVPNPLTDEELRGSVSLVTEADNLVGRFAQLSLALTRVRNTPSGQRYQFYVYRLA